MKKKLSLSLTLGLVASLLIMGIVFAAPAGKVDVCHLDGNGTYHLINISENAFDVHVAHGDAAPSSPAGAPYPGLYGSTVTPVLGDDCSTVLRIDSLQSFAVGGWAGWSCVETGYPHVVGGGVVPGTAGVMAQGPAKYGAASVGGYNYPVYPHYTFNGGVNAPGGEEGWVVRADSPVPTGIFVLCGP
jgi:hypothetical protein